MPCARNASKIQVRDTRSNAFSMSRLAIEKRKYNRLLPILDSHQSYDQFGFRPDIRLEDALVVLETLISKTRELNIPLWIASLDLKKAFDNIPLPFIFSALRAQCISDELVLLLLDLYAHQHRRVSGSK